MKTYGLIGYPLGHSFSRGYFTEKFEKEGIEAQYCNFELEEIELLPELIKGQNELAGLNVTIPHKRGVIPYLDDLDDHARNIGAVNTIVFKNEQFIGYNTDWLGFRDSLAPHLNQNIKQKALILGTGGSSKAVDYTFQQLGIDADFVSTSNSEHFSYEDLKTVNISQYGVIVNTTPLGMYPREDHAPDIPYERLLPIQICYDLVYNPAETLFLKKAAEQKCLTHNGLEMLEIQADASWKLWNEH